MYAKFKSQRYPFDFIDRILQCDQKKSRTLKNLTKNEWALNWSEKEGAYLPWWVLAECMAQTAGRFDEYLRQYKNRVVLTKMNQVNWQRLIHPGEQLIIEAQVLKQLESQSVFHVSVLINDIIVGQGDFYFATASNEIFIE